MLSPAWKCIDEHDKRLYEEICVMTEIIPDDFGLGNDRDGIRIRLLPHIVARAFARVFSEDLRCVDGFFAGQFQHSWLTTNRFSLIDVCAATEAVGQPLLFLNHPACVGRPVQVLYQEEPSVIHGVYKNVGKWQFERAVGILTDFLIALH